MNGYEVVLSAAGSFTVPRACCRCGEPGTVERKSVAQVSGARKTRTVTLPYCAPCAQRAKTIDGARSRLQLGVFGFALAAAFLALLVPFLPVIALIVLSTGLAIMFAVVMRQRAGDTVEFPNSAWLAAASNKANTFFIANQQWAEAFAKANATEAKPVRRTDNVSVWVIALLVTGIGSAIVANLARPSVYVDNEGPKPLQIWIDGKKSIVAQPMKPELGDRPKIELPFGSHRFGWSEVGAAAPTSQTEPKKIELAGDHLYNPASTGCYDLVLSVYGSDSGSGIVAGPVPITELYTFKSIDNWFSENPKSISTKSSGGTRMSLQPLAICKTLHDNDCSMSIVTDMMSCLHEHQDDAGSDLCVDKAAKACGLVKKK